MTYILKPETLEVIAKIIGHTTDGLTGSEIHRLLEKAGLPDHNPDFTKYKRVFNSFAQYFNNHKNCNSIIKAIELFLNPTQYVNEPELFEHRRKEINKVLSFEGLYFDENGNIKESEKVKNLNELEKKFNTFLERLEKRNIHNKIKISAHEEILSNNYFHSVFEASKSILDRIREITGLTDDGSCLIDKAFKIDNPYIYINGNLLRTKTEQNEYKGFIYFLKGIVAYSRNPAAHELKIKKFISEEQALDIITIISFCHKILDQCGIARTAN